ncbi:MAG: hypothetical protein AB1735_09060 [Pseudomonadota bacterium]|jgi:hypothetical protein
MQTDDDQKHLRAEAAFIVRREDSVRELNQRIDRLAHALALDLQQPGTIDRLIRQVKIPAPPSNASPSYSGPERRARAPDGSSERRRKDILYYELRGLVVLRYELVSAFASQFGSQVMMQMLASVDLRPWDVGLDGAAAHSEPLSSS